MTHRAVSRQWIKLVLAVAATLPALLSRIVGVSFDPVVGILVFGAAIVGASFILLWAGEAAQMDVSSGLAIAALAVIAVLPEYAVDLYFAFRAGTEHEYAAFAAANMTGSNRLLLGLGWSGVVLVAWIGYRYFSERNRVDETLSVKPFAIRLLDNTRLDLGILLIASLMVIAVPLTGEISLFLSVLLFLLFSWYLYLASSAEVLEPELSGMSKYLADKHKTSRRIWVIGLLALSAVIILFSAEPFADSLVTGGRSLGIDDFLLVQWLAPLASEAPEFLLAFMLAFSGRSAMAIGILIAAKVNQWTLLVGSLPIAYLVGGGDMALPMDSRQVEEFVLTLAQTLLGIALLLGFRFSWRSALSLFVLFSLTFIFTDQEARWIVAVVYLVIAVPILIFRYRQVWDILRRPFQFASPTEAS